MMAVFRYRGTIKEREDFTEMGTVVAKTEVEAIQKLKERHFSNIKLKKLGVLSSFVLQFSADIR